MAEVDENSYDLCVIGAGTSGIVSARFYLDIHPHAKVVLLERDQTVGGVWSSERAYPGFRSQGGLRGSGFSDIKFTPNPEDVDEYDFYKSTAMAKYLDDYVDRHVYDGKTLRERILFGVSVAELRQTSNGWVVSYDGGGEKMSASARKVIVATGSTSVPQIPELKGREDYSGPIVHTLEYGRSKIYERKDIESVAVLGAGKSAADMVYENVKAGRSVKWIIRASGKGPGGFVDTMIKALGANNAAELGLIRFVASLLTLPGLQNMSWYQWFLYKTRIGGWWLGKFRKFLTNQITASARYDDRPGARETFKLLKTEMDGTALQVPAGGCHHKDFWETIAHNVDVYRADIDHLSKGTLHFKDGTSTQADAILLGTGFKDLVPFVTNEQAIQMGLPHPLAAESEDECSTWAARESLAAKRLHDQFYSITPPPLAPPENKLGDISPDMTPYRLYSGIIPTNPSLNNSIAFVGFATLTNMFASSELSAIYATAYLDGKLNLPSEEEMKQDVAYVTTYMRLRCPTYGRIGNWYIFDLHQTVDRWMEQVGLSSYRKIWWKDTFSPLFAEDLKGLKDEYIAKYGGGS